MKQTKIVTDNVEKKTEAKSNNPLDVDKSQKSLQSFPQVSQISSYFSSSKNSKHSDKKYNGPETVANPEIPMRTREVSERLIDAISECYDVYEKHWNKLENNFSLAKLKTQVDSLESFRQLRNTLMLADIKLKSVNFFRVLVDKIFSIYFCQLRYKADLKQSLVKLTHNEMILDKIHSKRRWLEVRKAVCKDDCKTKSFIFNLWIHTDDPEINKIEEELRHFLTHVPSDVPLPINFINIIDFFEPDTTNLIYDKIADYVQTGRVDETIATIILSMGITSGYYGDFLSGYKIIQIAVKYLKKLSKNRTKVHLLPIAEGLILLFDKRYAEAAKLISAGLNELHDSVESAEIKNINLMLGIAYFLHRCDPKNDAIRILEEIEMNLYLELPRNKTLWLRTITLIGKCYNEIRDSVKSSNYLTKAIEYYHERLFGAITPTNRPISEIAQEMRLGGSAASNLLQILTPKLGYLPPMVMNCFNELNVAFALQNNVNGIGVLDKYIKDCQNFYKSNDIAQDNEDEDEINIRINRINEKQSIMLTAAKAKKTKYNVNPKTKKDKKSEEKSSTTQFLAKQRASISGALASKRMTLTAAFSNQGIKKIINKDESDQSPSNISTTSNLTL